MGLFGPPNVEKLKAKGDVEGLIKALVYKKDANVRKAAAEALEQITNEQAIKSLIDALQDENRDVQETAAGSLVQIIKANKNENLRKPAIKGLVTSFDCGKASVRKAVVMALGKIKEAWAMQLLITALESSTNEVRYAAAEALGKIGDTYAVTPLITALKNPDKNMRELVIKALKQIGQPVVLLSAALKNEDKDMRVAAAEALDQIGWQPDKTEIGAFYWIAKGQWKKCIELGESAVKPLSAILKEADGNVRKAEAEALGQIKDMRAVDPLIAALQDQDWRVREAAACALGQINDARAVELLISALKDQEWCVRKEAARALGRINDARAVEPLIAALTDQEFVREVVAEALGQIGDARAVDSLINLVKYGGDRSCKAEAKVLVKLYHSGKLDPQSKQQILAQRDRITKLHYDRSIEPCGLHDDLNMGVDFPL
jgi:HEAT repeat protein